VLGKQHNHLPLFPHSRNCQTSRVLRHNRRISWGLKTLVRGNPVQETNLAELQSLIARRLGPNPDTVAFSKTHSADAAAEALTDQGQDALNEIRDVLFRMREQQTDLLVTRQQTAEARFIFDQTASPVLVGVTAIAPTPLSPSCSGLNTCGRSSPSAPGPAR
jgi:CHASE3 domain sensor protein